MFSVFHFLLPLFFLHATVGTRCYECGHMRVNGGDAVAVPDSNVTFCAGFVDTESLVIECPLAEDCCTVVKEFTNTTDGETGVSTEVEFVMHGCFDKAPSKYELTCEGASPDIQAGCKEFDVDTIPDDHHIENQYAAEVCLCTGDECNHKGEDPGTTAKPGDGIECYSCGYMKIDGGNPEAVGEKPFCNDFVDAESLATKCPNKQDCCVILKEFTNTTDDQTGKSTAVEFTLHGCFEDTASKYELSCETAKPDIHDECKVFDVDSLPHDHIENQYRAEACLCNEARCNNNVPPTDPPTGPTDGTTAEPPGPHQQCYNCGYRQRNDGDFEPLPETAPCNAFVDPDSVTVNCLAEEDCCAITRLFQLEMNTETGKNDSIVEVRHGCFNMMGIEEEHKLTCADAGADITTDCKVYEEDTLPDSHHQEGFYREEICMCQDPLCNNEVPNTTPNPNNPTTTTGAASALPILSSALSAAIVYLLL